jgi:hypothetical protein
LLASVAPSTLEGSSDCGSWRLDLSPDGENRLLLEERIVWTASSSCTGSIEGLAEARRRLLGL